MKSVIFKTTGDIKPSGCIADFCKTIFVAHLWIIPNLLKNRSG